MGTDTIRSRVHDLSHCTLTREFYKTGIQFNLCAILVGIDLGINETEKFFVKTISKKFFFNF